MIDFNSEIDDVLVFLPRKIRFKFKNLSLDKFNVEYSSKNQD